MVLFTMLNRKDGLTEKRDTMKEWTIADIENLTYSKAKDIAVETMTIKEHEIFFVEFNGYFGYSVLVFKDEKHIRYANDYELHHNYFVKENGKEKLKEMYIEMLNNKLYTDAEMMQSCKSYSEYQSKNKFLRDYYILRFDYLSIFGIGKNTQNEFDRLRPEYPFYNDISFCYVKDKNIVETQHKYMECLKKSYDELKTNEDTFRKMISYELDNHEACITLDYTDALFSLNLKFHELEDWQKKIVVEELNKSIRRYNEAGVI